MITTTAMTPMTTKQKSKNISLYTTKTVVIAVLMRYLPMPFGRGAINSKLANFSFVTF